MGNNKEITIMLEALLINAGQLHWVGGYAPHLSDKGDPFVALYPASDYLDIKVCRVYEGGFKHLPPFVDVVIPSGVVGGKKTLSKSEAIEKGLYRDTPKFKIVTVNGKETNFGYERRFYKTLWYPRGDRQSFVPVASSVPSGAVGEFDPWDFSSGGNCPVSFRPLFSRHENETGERPLSLDQLKEWYRGVKQ